MITIGGLPAELFLQRAIRVRKGGAARHMMPCVLKAVNDRKLVVRPAGHKHDEEIDPESVHPWWAKNPDLKKMLTNQNTQSEVPVVPIAALVQSSHEHTPTAPVEEPASVVEAPVASSLPWQPNDDSSSVLIVPVSAPISWLSVYERYVRTKQDADEALSMHRSLEADAKLLEEQLSAFGVHIQGQTGQDQPAQPLHPTPHQALTHEKFKRSVSPLSNRHIVQNKLDDWVRNKAIVGRIYSCAQVTSEAGVHRHTFELLKNRLNQSAKRAGRTVKLTVTLAGKKRMSSFEFAHK